MSVRVRYAPSPTGFQHIGSVRTALYNYLFARRQGGTFILRIEDTDRSASCPRRCRTSMTPSHGWASTGTRVRTWAARRARTSSPSARRSTGNTRRSLSQKAPPIRATARPESLEKLREGAGRTQIRQGLRPALPHPSGRGGRAAEARARRGDARHRLKIPLEGTTTFTDVLLGDITVENKDINPDPVLIKSDGFPTYHMANVVDDHLMEITHIMRAQEWLPSAPLHKILYEALRMGAARSSATCPWSWARTATSCPSATAPRASASSGRMGYLPDALINYIALVGWSYDDARELFTLGELEKLFNMEKINKAPGGLRLPEAGLVQRDATSGRRAGRSSPGLDRRPSCRRPGTSRATAAEEALLDGVAGLVQERVKLLTEVPAMVRLHLRGARSACRRRICCRRRRSRGGARGALRRLAPLLPELSASRRRAGDAPACPCG